MPPYTILFLNAFDSEYIVSHTRPPDKNYFCYFSTKTYLVANKMDL